MTPKIFQLTRVDVRRLRFSLIVHSKFVKIQNLIFSNTSRQGLGKSLWRWKPLQTRCVLVPKILQHHRTTSNRDFRDPTILPQVTTIQDFTIETYSTASQIDVFATVLGSFGARKAQVSKCIVRILYDKSRKSLVPNRIRSLTYRIRAGALNCFRDKIHPNWPKPSLAF